MGGGVHAQPSSPRSGVTGDPNLRGPAPQRFTATLEERWVVVPLDARALWGEARPPVAGTVNGDEFRGRLMVYGGETVLGLTNAFRAQAGIEPGDEVEVEIDRDDAPREVAIPPELQTALDADDGRPRGLREALVHPPPRVRGVDRGRQARGHARAPHRPHAGDAARGRQGAVSVEGPRRRAGPAALAVSCTRRGEPGEGCTGEVSSFAVTSCGLSLLLDPLAPAPVGRARSGTGSRGRRSSGSWCSSPTTFVMFDLFGRLVQSLRVRPELPGATTSRRPS